MSEIALCLKSEYLDKRFQIRAASPVMPSRFDSLQ